MSSSGSAWSFQQHRKKTPWTMYRCPVATLLAANRLGRSIAPEYFFPADVTRQQTNMTFKSVLREKCSDAVCMMVSACLLARRNPKLTISFCNIGIVKI
jgi:hypothetical protein